jgi:hypothetical protein
MAGNNDGTATGMFNNKEILVAYANGPLNVMASKKNCVFLLVPFG